MPSEQICLQGFASSVCFCHIIPPSLYRLVRKSSPYCIRKSSTAIIAPSTIEMQTTATDCFSTSFLSGHTIFLYSAFKPLKKLGLFAFSFLAESAISTPFLRKAAFSCNQIIWFPCVMCEFCRICNTS